MNSYEKNLLKTNQFRDLSVDINLKSMAQEIAKATKTIAKKVRKTRRLTKAHYESLGSLYQKDPDADLATLQIAAKQLNVSIKNVEV